MFLNLLTFQAYDKRMRVDADNYVTLQVERLGKLVCDVQNGSWSFFGCGKVVIWVVVSNIFLFSRNHHAAKSWNYEPFGEAVVSERAGTLH